jgi:hypothetical protein
MWERNRDYKGNKCLVCGVYTRDLAAPLGIVSGSFPCCATHEDRPIVTAYLKWCTARQTRPVANG